jgi:WD40 repeat protein
LALRAIVRPSEDLCPLVFSGDGKTLALASGANKIELWDTAGLLTQATLRVEPNEPHYPNMQFRISADGTVLLGWDTKGPRAPPTRFQVWNVPTQELHKVTLGPLIDFALAPDGKTLAVAAEEERLKFIDPFTGKEKAP